MLPFESNVIAVAGKDPESMIPYSVQIGASTPVFTNVSLDVLEVVPDLSVINTSATSAPVGSVPTVTADPIAYVDVLALPNTSDAAVTLATESVSSTEAIEIASDRESSPFVSTAKELSTDDINAGADVTEIVLPVISIPVPAVSVSCLRPISVLVLYADQTSVEEDDASFIKPSA